MPSLLALANVGDTPGRETFLGFAPWATALFYVLTAISIGFFFLGFWQRIKKYRQGRAAGRGGLLRLMRAVGVIASQRTVAKRDRYVGVAHFLVFWGFLVMLAGTSIIAIDEDIIGLALRRPEWQFWTGTFYVVYALVLDLFGIGFIVGLLMLAYRRNRMRPPRLEYDRVDGRASDRDGYRRDDRVFMLILLFLGVSGFFLEGFRIAATDFPGFEAVSFAGWIIGKLFAGLGTAANDVARMTTWWVHTLAALSFVAYVPYSKGMHTVTDIVDLLFTKEGSARSLPPVEDAAAPGYATLSAFTWKELLDQDACTKCGRCDEVCPARASGAPLARDLILDLREYSDAKAGIDLWYGPGATPRHEDQQEVAGGVILAETLWACTTCMACMEVCPVGIEHVPTIVQLRRRLVDLGDVESGLQSAFQALARGGNSFGKSARQRARWTRDLEVPIKDVREEAAEYLWFVGDYASFDPRATEVSQSVARLLQAGGVDFGILHDGEANSGNDVRRAGEEGLFEMLRDQNMEALAAADYKRILTTDPHTLNALRNEYPIESEVLHYTQILDQLVTAGTLTVGRLDGTATYHDPCYLGRYAEEYDAPRRLIQATGVELVEMGRCRENSFCCGAGGGRIWMDDSGLEERPSENRIREAVALGEHVRYFVVACPKDLAMYSEAVKATGNEGRIEVLDIAQLIERAREAVPVG